MGLFDKLFQLFRGKKSQSSKVINVSAMGLICDLYNADMTADNAFAISPRRDVPQ